MLIEQIIEFEWRGVGPLDRTCTLTTGYFTSKQKSLKKIFEWIITVFTTKILTKFNPYCNIINVFSTKV